MAGRRGTTDEQKELLSVIGSVVRALREEAGLTQSEVGQLIDSDDKYMSRVERGLVNVSATKLIQLADVLGVPTGALLDDAASTYTGQKRSAST